jgi:hypothetical protein
MRAAIIILAILLAATNCYAINLDHITYNYHVRGSLKIKYTGLKKIIVDEVRDLFEDEWRSDAETYFNGGQISFSQYRTSLRRLAVVRQHYGLNGGWWERNWFHSLPPHKGGAPPPVFFVVGRTGDIIDLGFARVNENFRFKFKEYTADINNEWRFKFRPRLTGNTTDIVSKATVSFFFEYSVKKKKVFKLVIEAGYRKRLREFIEFRIEMFNL